jgi:hypothetical protein
MAGRVVRYSWPSDWLGEGELGGSVAGWFTPALCEGPARPRF